VHNLRVDCAGPKHQLPVGWTSDHVEGAREDEHVAAELAVDRGEFREADVVADTDTDAACGAVVLREVKDWRRVEDLGFMV
jgi:hypothetical protein